MMIFALYFTQIILQYRTGTKQTKSLILYCIVSSIQIVISMFDELLEQMESTLKDIKIPKTAKRQTWSNGSADGIIDCTKSYGKVVSFGKTVRFRDREKQELKTSHIQWPKDSENAVSETRKYSFSKKQRFQSDKPKYTDTYINPDIAVVKKNTKNNVPIYRSPSKQLTQSKVSVSTVDSQTFRAPGLYNPQDISKVKQGIIGKDTRFKAEKSKYEGMPLFVNQNQIKRRPPMSAVMKKKTAKTRNLISQEKQEELREKLKFVYWKSIPLQLDRLFKDKRGAIIKDNYFDLSKLTGTAKRSALLHLMERMHYLRGGYQQDIQTKMDSACAVVYRKSTPKPFKFSQMEPGPDYYYPQDDYLKPTPAVFSFAKEGLKPKRVQYDYRDYQINQDLMKKGGNIVINPLHQEFRLDEEQIAALERGPGFYDCLFSQVQKRNDIGAVKYQEITAKNDRQNNCIEVKEVCDGIYFPSYDAIDPNTPAPLYKKPANVRPTHLPEKELFPQHWLFYDGDLNKVRAQIAKNVILAKNMSFDDYNSYKTKFNRFKEYLQIQRRGPEAGQYEVSYKGIDPHVAVVDFEKQEEKNMLEPIKKPQGDADGDNLILNPREIQPHLPDFNFSKMEGREEVEIDRNGEAREGDRLLLEPKKPEKHVPNVYFDKQQGRPEPVSYGQDEAGPQGDVLMINPKPVQPHIPSVNIEKQAQRKQIRIEQDQNEQVNVLNPHPPSPKIKGVPFSRMTSVKLIPLLRESKLQGNQEQQQQ